METIILSQPICRNSVRFRRQKCSVPKCELFYLWVNIFFIYKLHFPQSPFVLRLRCCLFKVLIYLCVFLYNFKCLQERVCKLCLKLTAGFNISSFSWKNAQLSSTANWTLSHHLFLQTKEGTVTCSPRLT